MRRSIVILAATAASCVEPDPQTAMVQVPMPVTSTVLSPAGPRPKVVVIHRGGVWPKGARPAPGFSVVPAGPNGVRMFLQVLSEEPLVGLNEKKVLILVTPKGPVELTGFGSFAIERERKRLYAFNDDEGRAFGLPDGEPLERGPGKKVWGETQAALEVSGRFLAVTTLYAADGKGETGTYQPVPGFGTFTRVVPVKDGWLRATQSEDKPWSFSVSDEHGKNVRRLAYAPLATTDWFAGGSFIAAQPSSSVGFQFVVAPLSTGKPDVHMTDAWETSRCEPVRFYRGSRTACMFCPSGNWGFDLATGMYFQPNFESDTECRHLPVPSEEGAHEVVLGPTSWAPVAFDMDRRTFAALYRLRVGYTWDWNAEADFLLVIFDSSGKEHGRATFHVPADNSQLLLEVDWDPDLEVFWTGVQREGGPELGGGYDRTGKLVHPVTEPLDETFDARRRVTKVPVTKDGHVLFFEDGSVQLVGDVPEAALGCVEGSLIKPFATCRDQALAWPHRSHR